MLLLLLRRNRQRVQASAGPKEGDQAKLSNNRVGFYCARTSIDLPIGSADQVGESNPQVSMHLCSQVVARSSLSILMVFLIMMVFILCKNRVSMIVNEGLFTVKYLLIVGLFILSLFLNSSVFVFYSQFARIVSLAYMLIQSVIVIDLFYIAGTKLVKRYNEG